MPAGYKKFAPSGRVTKRKPAAKPKTGGGGGGTSKFTPSGKDLPTVAGSSSEYISTITALKRRDAADEALYLLQKIASMVKPVMKAQGLRVGTLCEFFPKDPRLLGLNVNHGMKICIRLRRHNNDKSFYPLTELLGTMLHELSHNRHGPHDDAFYKYMGELRTHLEGLMAQGFTGDGLFGEGRAVGKSPFGPNGRTLSGLPPAGPNGLVDPVKLAEAKKQAALQHAAEAAKPKRSRGRKLGTLTTSVGNGGGGGLGGAQQQPLSIRELALRAAEQRIQDAKWCGGNQNASLEELGMDDDVIEIKASEFGGRPGSSSSSNSIPNTNSQSAALKPPPKKSSSAGPGEVIDLTED